MRKTNAIALIESAVLLLLSGLPLQSVMGELLCRQARLGGLPVPNDGMKRGERFPGRNARDSSLIRVSLPFFLDGLTGRFVDTPSETLSRPFRGVKAGKLIAQGVKSALQIRLTDGHGQVSARLFEDSAGGVGRSAQAPGDRV